MSANKKIYVTDELKAIILHKVNELRTFLFGQLSASVKKYQKMDAYRELLEYCAEKGVVFRGEDHFKKQYYSWKSIALDRNKSRQKTGSAPIPPLQWENIMFEIERDNPRFNTGIQVCPIFLLPMTHPLFTLHYSMLL